jgi:hypothetical protein
MRSLSDLSGKAVLLLATISHPVTIASPVAIPPQGCAPVPILIPVAVSTPVHGPSCRLPVVVALALGVMDGRAYRLAEIPESRGLRGRSAGVGGCRGGFGDLIPDLPARGTMASPEVGGLAPCRHRGS